MIDCDRLRDIRNAFVSSAKRARRIGLDLIQLHCAHGYLLHQFLSPLSNQRDDTYGGSLENRMRFPLEVFEAVRQAIPDRPVTVRISGTDWVEGGWNIEQTCAFATMLEAAGCDAVHISSGGLHPAQRIPVGPSYQVPLARAVKTAVRIPVITVGLITGFDQAEAIVATREADMLALARTILYDPRWPWHAAAELGAQVRHQSNTFGRSLEGLGIFWYRIALRGPRLPFWFINIYELLHRSRCDSVGVGSNWGAIWPVS
jgi:2,4-dienoyl-CoA reductase-like NADH-dependent reductase (Old Yellow Enzyme family)